MSRFFSNKTGKITQLSTLKVGGGENLLRAPTLLSGIAALSRQCRYQTKQLCENSQQVTKAGWLKGPVWPLCFACLCCCFGFQGSEALIVIKEFYSGRKQNFQHHKMAAKRSQRALLNGQYQVFKLKWKFQVNSSFKLKILQTRSTIYKKL